jgi:G3E family GTPase
MGLSCYLYMTGSGLLAVATVRAVNANAPLVVTERCRVPVDTVLGIEAFSAKGDDARAEVHDTDMPISPPLHSPELPGRLKLLKMHDHLAYDSAVSCGVATFCTLSHGQ